MNYWSRTLVFGWSHIGADLKDIFRYRFIIDTARIGLTLMLADSYLLFPIPRDTSTGCRGTTLEDCNSVKTLSDDVITNRFSIASATKCLALFIL